MVIVYITFISISHYNKLFCKVFENKLKFFINFTKEWLHWYILLILHIEEFNIKRFLKVTNYMDKLKFKNIKYNQNMQNIIFN